MKWSQGKDPDGKVNRYYFVSDPPGYTIGRYNHAPTKSAELVAWKGRVEVDSRKGIRSAAEYDVALDELKQVCEADAV